MPNWRPYLNQSLANQSTVTWITISQIQEFCKRQAGSNQKPSAPCVKNYLVHRIQLGEVVGKKGSGGSAYFKLRSAYTPGSEPPLPGQGNYNYRRSDRGRHARSECETFNRQVDQAIRESRPLPLPFDQVSISTTQVERARVQIRSSRGAIIEEAHSVGRYCTENNPRSVNAQALEDIRTYAAHILENLPVEVRGHLDREDVAAVIREHLPQLQASFLAKAREKARSHPGMVEDEYLNREWWRALNDDDFLSELLETEG